MSAIDKLKDMGYTLFESEAPDRQKYDFSISDGEDSVAWAWGDDHDLDYECNHPSDCIEWDRDDDTAPTGECLLCGSHCSGHYEADTGNVEDFCWAGQELRPTEWYLRRDVGGLIGKYLKELQGKNA